MALSSRLATIDEQIIPDYDVIWDCCCDHGQLGMQLLKRSAAKTVQFVDIIPSIMQQLTQKLSQFSPKPCEPDWQVHCLNVASIKPDPRQKNLIIIAGIGGELLLSLVKSILNTYQSLTTQFGTSNCHPIEFIICPVHHTYTMRTGLRELGLGLISEQIICENNRYYEVIHLSQDAETVITSTGNMWDVKLAEHSQYLKKLLVHYTKLLNKDPDFYSHVISQYKRILAN